MWKILVTFVFSRAVLFVVALFAINQKWTPPGQKGFLPKIQPLVVLEHQFLKQINDAPEARRLKELRPLPFFEKIKVVKNPVYWLGASLLKVFPFSEALFVLILSQIFCFFIFRETYQILNRIINEEVAISSVILLILWPKSFQWSLGLSFPFEVFLILIATRQALDNQWLQTGLALGVLSLSTYFPYPMLPYLFFLFFFFQRHFQWAMVIKKLFYFLLPLTIGMLASKPSLAQVVAIFQGISISKLLFLFHPSQMVSLSTLALVLMLCGMVAAFLNYAEWIHKLLPAHLFFLVLALVPAQSFAYYIAIAGIVFECVVRISGSFLLRGTQMMLWGLSIYSTYHFFV